MRPIDDLEGQLTAAATEGSGSALRLVALLWAACPEGALEQAARSEHPVERLASARHPRTPESARPWIRSTGPEVDGIFWLTVVEHLTTIDDGIGGAWMSLDRASRALAQLATTGGLVDTAAISIGQDLLDAAAPESPATRLAELGLHRLPLVSARLLPRRDLPESAELAMTLDGAHPLILEKLALRSRSPLTLARLAGRRERTVEREVTSNPHVHPDTLGELLARSRVPASELAGNPALPAELQLAIAHRRYEGADAFFQGQAERMVGEALARNPRCTAEVLQELIDRPGLLRADFVAAHPRVPAGRLVSLAENAWWQVRKAVAGNPSLPHEAAQRLMDQVDDPADRHGVVGAELAGNPACPPDLLRQLHARARAAWTHPLAGNPSCPDDLRRDLEQGAASDPHLRRALARNPRTSPTLLGAWAEAGEAGVTFQLAANPGAPPSLLATLARARDWSTASAAAMNPACPREALERVVADDTASMRGALFDNPACDLALLEQAFFALVEDQLFESSMVQKARDRLWLRAHPGGIDATSARS